MIVPRCRIDDGERDNTTPKARRSWSMRLIREIQP
jgi:hypothetical protein